MQLRSHIKPKPPRKKRVVVSDKDKERLKTKWKEEGWDAWDLKAAVDKETGEDIDIDSVRRWIRVFKKGSPIRGGKGGRPVALNGPRKQEAVAFVNKRQSNSNCVNRQELKTLLNKQARASLRDRKKAAFGYTMSASSLNKYTDEARPEIYQFLQDYVDGKL
jgi:hypothetical protein